MRTRVTIMDRSAGTADAAPGIRIGLAGDVMLGRLVNDMLRERGCDYPWGNLPATLGTFDAFMVNLECSVTERVVKWRDQYDRPFHFRADPVVTETLRGGRVDVATIANNHIGDFGFDGLRDTVGALDRAGIAHAGAGRDLDAARAPALLTVRGIRVAVLAFADYPDTWSATDRSPGLNFIRVSVKEADFAPVAESIRAARAQADLVIVSIHWGPNMRERPTVDFQRFAHRVIDAGASILWGHSAHILQGVEFRGDGVILYDTGDCIDDYAVDPTLRNDRGALFVVDAVAHRITNLSLAPLFISRMQANSATGSDRAWVIRRMQALCAEFGSRVIEQPDGSVRVIRGDGDRSAPP